MSLTTLCVERRGPRHAARFRHGLLRPQVVAADERRCRVGLLATTALLLGGDVVGLHVQVGPGARLELFDVAATVAYHGRGRGAGWHVRVDVAAGASVTYAGAPFVVADGAEVDRTLEVDLAPDAEAVLRDTVVLGRDGERGGPLRTRTTVRVDGRLVLLEDQQLGGDGLREAAGMLGRHRVLDSVLALGAAARGDAVDAAPTYALLDDIGTLTRWLGSSVAESPLTDLDLARA